MRHIGRVSMPSALRGSTGGGTTPGGGGATAYQRATGNAGGVSSAMSGTAAQSAAANTNIDQMANSGNAHYDARRAGCVCCTIDVSTCKWWDRRHNRERDATGSKDAKFSFVTTRE